MAEMFRVHGVESDGTVKGETYADATQTAEYHEPDGFHHHPEQDTMGVLLNVGGHAGHQVVLAPRHPGIEHDSSPGDTVIYSVKDGAIQSTITIRSNGDIEISGKSVKVKAEGDIDINGLGVNLNGGSKQLVTFGALALALTRFAAELKVDLTTHFALAMPASPPAPGVTYNGNVIFDISPAATSTVKTGG